MRTLVLVVCLMWGWFFFHDQIKTDAQVGFIQTMAWFGVDTRQYFAAAQTGGTSGVLDTLSAQVQTDAARYMNGG